MRKEIDSQPSYEVIDRAVSPLGVKRVAKELKVSSVLVYKWCQPPQDVSSNHPNGSGSSNPLDRIEALVRLTGGKEIVPWVCRVADGFFTQNPLGNKAGREDLFENIQRLVKEFSDTLDAISTSYKQGSAINPIEAKRIRREWDQLKSVGEGLVVACESGCYGSKKRSAGGK